MSCPRTSIDTVGARAQPSRFKNLARRLLVLSFPLKNLLKTLNFKKIQKHEADRLKNLKTSSQVVVDVSNWKVRGDLDKSLCMKHNFNKFWPKFSRLKTFFYDEIYGDTIKDF